MANDQLIDQTILSLDAFSEDPRLADTACRIFEFTRFLIDDDDNLTRAGNLNARAKDALRQRTLEVLGVKTFSDENTEENEH